MQRVLRGVASPLLYARVDVAPGTDGRPAVMELELIEPSLYLSRCAEAAPRLAAAIRDRLRELPEA